MMAVQGYKPRHDSGTLECKTRVVVCGQFEAVKPGESTSTSQVDLSSIRTASAIAAVRGWSFGTADVKGAFLNNQLDADDIMKVRLPMIYLRMGVVTEQELDYMLTHSVYGRRVSPRQWSSKRDGDMTTFDVDGMTLDRCTTDSDVWRLLHQGRVVGCLLTYVDDFLVLCEPQRMEKVLSGLAGLWDLGTVATMSSTATLKYDGLIFEDQGTHIAVHQQDYIIDLLHRHQLHHANGCLVPGLDEDELPPEQDATPALVAKAQEVVGELIYVSTRTRPDVCHAVGTAATMVSSRPAEAILRCKKVLRYLRSTVSYRLQYKKGPAQDLHVPDIDNGIKRRLEFERSMWKEQLEPEVYDLHIKAFGDASFAGAHSKSCTGAIVMIGSGAVSWRSKRQTMLSESSTEAELQGQSETSSMAIGTKELAAELGCKVLASQRCDNRSTIAQVAGGTSWRTRALTSRARCLRQRVQVYELYLGHIPGAVHPGDGLTKHLGRVAHRQAVCLWCLDGPDTHQFVADYEGLMVEGDNVFFDETAQVAMEDDELINAGSSGDGGDDDFTFMQFDPYEEAYNGMVKLISNVAVNVIRQSATMATTAADLGPAVAPIIKSTELRCDCPKCPEQVCDLLTANIMSALFGAGCGAAAMSYCCVRCCRGQALQSSDDDDVDDELFDVVESRNVATMTTTEWHQNRTARRRRGTARRRRRRSNRR